MSKLSLRLLTLMILCISFKTYAQDPHFSSALFNQKYLNPANTGLTNQQIQLYLIHRSQWIGKNFKINSQGFIAEKRINRLSLSGTIIKSSAGDASIKQLLFNGGMSYTCSFQNHHLTGGIRIGLHQKSFDLTSMTFDDQYYDDIGFIPSNITSETFSYTKSIRQDVSSGLTWTYKKEKIQKLIPWAGVSIQHLIPAKDLFITDYTTTKQKLNLTFGASTKINDILSISPMVLYSRQSISSEFLIGSAISMALQEQKQIEVGMYYRNNNALIIQAGIRTNGLGISLGYDVSTSSYYKQGGAFEIGLTYSPKIKEKTKETVKKKEASKDKKALSSNVPYQSPTSIVNSTSQKKEQVASAKKKPNTVKGKSTASKQTTAKGKPSPVNKKAVPTPEKAVNTTTKKEVIPLPEKIISKSAVEIFIEPSEWKLIDNYEKYAFVMPTLQAEEEVIVESVEKATMKNAVVVSESEEPLGNIIVPTAIKNEKDTDYDGVPDNIDQCKNEFGSIKYNGCPTPERDNIIELATKTGIIPFKRNSVQMHGVYKLDVIEPALDSVWFNDNYDIYLTGHIEAGENETWALKRAEFVKAIFVKKGLNPSRITVKSMLATKPLENNSSENTNNHNRRVEVYVIKKRPIKH